MKAERSAGTSLGPRGSCPCSLLSLVSARVLTCPALNLVLPTCWQLSEPPHLSPLEVLHLSPLPPPGQPHLALQISTPLEGGPGPSSCCRGLSPEAPPTDTPTHFLLDDRVSNPPPLGQESNREVFSGPPIEYEIYSQKLTNLKYHR